MTAYYNEIDPYAAEWLRNLIAGGHIAPGVVDERSIEDVAPEEIREFTQCHFFAGIGIWSAALRRSGWDDERPVWTGSCPCQPFSAAGKGGGFDDERHLWPAWHWLIDELQPRTIFGEQVASKDGLGWFDLVSSDMEGTGYAVAPIDLCAAGVGAPHLRQRLWFAAQRLANSNGWHTSSQWEQRGGQHGQFEANGGAERVAKSNDAGSQGRVGCRPHGAEGKSSGHGAERSSSLRVGNTLDQPRERDTRGFSGTQEALNGARERVNGGEFERSEYASSGVGREYGLPGATNGHWREADWLFCTDGKWRPVEPGTFPLAHGLGSRMGRLRAYGNGICLEAAQAVIESFLDCRP